MSGGASDIVTSVTNPVSQLFNGFQNETTYETPTVEVSAASAAAAPTRRTDTGAIVKVGSKSTKNNRVSGTGSGSTRTSLRSLGSVGSSGLRLQ